MLVCEFKTNSEIENLQNKSHTKIYESTVCLETLHSRGMKTIFNLISKHALIGIGPFTQLRMCVLKIVHIQGRSPNVLSDIPYQKELLLKKRICSLWEETVCEWLPKMLWLDLRNK